MNIHALMRSSFGRILGVLCLCTTLAAQTPTLRGQDADAEAAKNEMKELFKKVERRLREIDRLLSDASAGDRTALKANADSGMGELLETSQARGRDVLEGIDRILEIAQELGDEQSSGGSGKGKPSEQPGQTSPLDQRGQQSTQREPTPAQPEQGDQQQGQKPGEKPGGEKPEGQQPKPGAGDQMPKDGKTSPDDPRNTPGSKPPGAATEGPSRNGDGPERWGELPVHARDVFRIEGGSDMPVQYRDWIDSYYRRLNKKP